MDAEISQLATKEGSLKMSVSAHSRRRADSGNLERYTHTASHESNGCPLKTTNFSYSCEERQGKTAWKELYLSNSRGQKNRLEKLLVLKMGVQGPPHQDSSNNS